MLMSVFLFYDDELIPLLCSFCSEVECGAWICFNEAAEVHAG
jgi:hypothetical protein